jgi:DegV family protein with EDD domain
MAIRIVTDSTCDLPADLVNEYDIRVIPCFVNMGGQSYLDGVQLSRVQFYENLPSLKSPPSTSAPGVGTFVDTYKNLASEGASEIISIHVSSTLSNIPNVAKMAAAVSDGIRVTVVDGGQLSLGTGFLALAAAKAASEGQTHKEIINTIDDQKGRTYAFAALDRLDYLRRSGRVSMLQSSLGSLLQIKPILKIHDGKVSLERVRTHISAMAKLVDIVKALQPLERLAILHTHEPGEAEVLKNKIEPFIPASGTVLFVEATPILGVHFGPGAVGFVCISLPNKTGANIMI